MKICFSMISCSFMSWCKSLKFIITSFRGHPCTKAVALSQSRVPFSNQILTSLNEHVMNFWRGFKNACYGRLTKNVPRSPPGQGFSSILL